MTVGESRLRRLVLALTALVLGLLALGMVVGMWLYLVETGRIHTGEALTVRVPDAEGMQPGAPVEIAGVGIGTVTGTAADGAVAELTLGLKGGASIPRGSRFVVASPVLDPPGGIRVLLPTGAAAQSAGHITFQDGPQTGESGLTLPASLAQANVLLAEMTQAGRRADQLMLDADHVTRRLNAAVQGVNGLVDDPRLHGDLARTLDNLQEASANSVRITQQMQAPVANLTQASSLVAETARDSRTQMHGILSDVHKSTGAVSGLTVKTTQLLQSPPVVKTMAAMAGDLKTTLDNLKSTSDHLNTLTDGGARVAGDSQAQRDIKDTLHNVRDMTVKANTLLDALTKLAQAAKH